MNPARPPIVPGRQEIGLGSRNPFSASMEDVVALTPRTTEAFAE